MASEIVKERTAKNEEREQELNENDVDGKAENVKTIEAKRRENMKDTSFAMCNYLVAKLGYRVRAHRLWNLTRW